MKTKPAGGKVVAAAMVMVVASSARAAGLTQGLTVIQQFQSSANTYDPAIAGLALVVLAVMWGLKVIHFRTLALLAGGVILAGSATQIVSILWSPS